MDFGHFWILMSLLIHYNNRMQSGVSFHKIIFVRFPCFGWDLKIFISGYTPRVFKRSFSWNYSMDCIHFLIYSCLNIIVTVCKAPFRSINYFCAFSVFWVGHRNIYKRVHATCIPTLVFMKLLDGFDSFLDILLLTHCSNCTQKAPFRPISYFVHFSLFLWRLITVYWHTPYVNSNTLLTGTT